MDRREARLALDLARQWHSEGLMPATSLKTLEQRHPAGAGDEDTDTGESFGASVLYGLGGVLLGAAVFALLVLLQDNGAITDIDLVAPWLFLAWGIVCCGAAFAIDIVAKRPNLADSFHVAALVAVTASGFPRADELPLGFLAVAFAMGILWYRRTRFMVPFLALTALNVAIASIVFGRLERSSDEVAFTVWFTYAVIQLVWLVIIGRMAKWPWPTTSLAAATLLLAGTFLGLWFDVISERFVGFQGDIEVFLAILMGAVMVAGLVFKEKGMVLAAALVLAIDSVVFAFDVGQLLGGLVAILAVAALLIWQAGNLRRYFREG